MKNLILLFVITASLFTACNSSSGTEKNAKTDTTVASSSAAEKASAGTITCKIDGKAASYPVPGFTEIALDPYGNGKLDGVLFGHPDPKKEGFQLEIKNSGTSKMTLGGGGDILCVINYYNAGGYVYTGQNITANVTSFDHKHLTGTFSGQLQSSIHTKDFPDLLNVTDGQFDIEQ